MTGMLTVRGLGSNGINTDIPPPNLPLNVFSYGENISTYDGILANAAASVQALKGYYGEVQFLLQRRNAYNNTETIYVSRDRDTGEDSIYIIRPENLANTDGSEKGELVSLPDYFTITEENNWQGFESLGSVVLNNGVDAPVVLAIDSYSIVDLPSWPETLRAKVLEPFKGVWVALNITDLDDVVGRQDNPYKVMWSSAVRYVGDVPDYWVPLDEAGDATGAGEATLVEDSSSIVAGKRLRDRFIIYKRDSVLAMDYTGSPTAPFTFRNLWNDIGCYDLNSVVEWEGRHVVVGDSDVYATDGLTRTSLVDSKWREIFYSKLFNDTRTQSVLLDIDRIDDVAYVVLQRLVGEQKYSEVYTYNFPKGQWSDRAINHEAQYLEALKFLRVSALPDESLLNWAEADYPWETMTETTWESLTPEEIGSVPRMTFAFEHDFYAVGNKYATNSNRLQGTLKKHDIDFNESGLDSRDGKNVYTLWPILTDSTGTLKLTIWGHERPGQDGVKEVVTMDMGADEKFDVYTGGRYISLELEAEEGSVMNLSGIDVELKPTAQR